MDEINMRGSTWKETLQQSMNLLVVIHFKRSNSKGAQAPLENFRGLDEIRNRKVKQPSLDATATRNLLLGSTLW